MTDVVDTELVAAFGIPGPMVGEERRDDPILRVVMWLAEQRDLRGRPVFNLERLLPSLPALASVDPEEGAR